MTTRLALLVGLAVGALGCGGGGDPITRIQSTYTGMVDAICPACPAAAGTATEAECRAAADANNPFDGPEWACARDAYNRFPNELGPYYDCNARAVSTFDGCMRNAIRTCPPSSTDISACNDALNAAIDACPLPDSVMAIEAVSACFSG